MPQYLSVFIAKQNIELTYQHDLDEGPAIGSLVRVPLQQKNVYGIVSKHVSDSPVSGHKLRNIISVEPTWLPIEQTLRLAQQLARHYLTSWPSIYLLFQKPETIDQQLAPRYQIKDLPEKRLSRTGEALRDFLQACSSASMLELHQAGFHKRSIHAALKQGWLIACEEKQHHSPQLIELNDEQRQAVEAFQHTGFHVSLLWGVTGSGKTECYAHVMAKVRQQGQQILVLVPEIGLIPQTMQRLATRLQETVLCYHSEMTEAEKYATRLAIHQQANPIVVGTRSSVFLPFQQLGLIIIDEEHDDAYQQTTGIHYHGRDVAILRAKCLDIPVLLGSATPSLRTVYNCQQGKFQRIDLKHAALNDQPVKVQIIDQKAENTFEGFTRSSLQHIEATLANNQHVLVFLNRRGWATRTICDGCGWVAHCPHCSVTLVLHAKTQQLLCHHCAYQHPTYTLCPDCQSQAPKAIGYGTERITEYLQKNFDQPVWCLDRDHIQSRSDLFAQIERLKQAKPSIIVGTQLLSKGHDFARVGLVVVHQADLGLYAEHPSSTERFVQQFFQIKGRCARQAGQQGRLLLQTRKAQNPLIQSLLADEIQPLYERLLAQRQEAQLPPFSYQARLFAESKHPDKALQFLQSWKRRLTLSHSRWLGPAPAPLEKRQGYYRFQCHLEANSREWLAKDLRLLLKHNPEKNHYSLRWLIELDPLD